MDRHTTSTPVRISVKVMRISIHTGAHQCEGDAHHTTTFSIEWWCGVWCGVWCGPKMREFHPAWNLCSIQ